MPDIMFGIGRTECGKTVVVLDGAMMMMDWETFCQFKKLIEEYHDKHTKKDIPEGIVKSFEETQ